LAHHVIETSSPINPNLPYTDRWAILKKMKRTLTIPFIILAFLSFAFVGDKVIEIEDGVGINSIKLGEKCTEKMIEEFGEKFNKSKYKGSGHLRGGGGFQVEYLSYDYAKLGITFNFQESTLSSQKGFFLTGIMFYNNFQCISSKGIKLGQSSFQNVTDLYGESKRQKSKNYKWYG